MSTRTLPNESSKLLTLYANIGEDMGWYGNALIQSVNLKRKPDTWLLIVKVRKNEKDWVCFSEGKTVDDCIEMFGAFCLTKSATGIKWIESKY